MPLFPFSFSSSTPGIDDDEARRAEIRRKFLEEIMGNSELSAASARRPDQEASEEETRPKLSPMDSFLSGVMGDSFQREESIDQLNEQVESGEFGRIRQDFSDQDNESPFADLSDDETAAKFQELRGLGFVPEPEVDPNDFPNILKATRDPSVPQEVRSRLFHGRTPDELDLLEQQFAESVEANPNPLQPQQDVEDTAHQQATRLRARASRLRAGDDTRSFGL